ncbi:MAG: M10 family metallopeptidase C-terminal domain-containing protein [Pseudomonadota bacterium]
MTRIPDGDNQARSSAFPGEIFKLGIGDQTQVVNKPVLTLNDLATGLLNAGIAETKGATSTIILEAEKSFVVNYKPGVIASEGTGIDVTGDHGKVLNNGLMTGDVNGARLAGEDGRLVNFGEVRSDSRAIDIVGIGTKIFNYGDITGTGDQRNGTVYADRTADDYKILNLKGGLIKAQDGGSAVSLQTGDANGDVVLAGVKNLGRIIGGGDAETGNQVGDGVRLFSSVKDAVIDGDIFNAGLVRASKYSDAAVGISIEDGIKLDGAILNYGRIVANAVAIDATEAGGHVNVVNAGVIRGDVNLSDGNDHYDGSYGRTAGVVEGGNGHDVLEGGFARDLLAGGQGDDELTGGYGRDVFIFRASDAKSEDVITDFEDHRDRIDVSHFGYSSLQQIGVAQKGDDVVLTFAKDNTVTLRDTDKADIGVDDFIF